MLLLLLLRAIQKARKDIGDDIDYYPCYIIRPNCKENVVLSLVDAFNQPDTQADFKKLLKRYHYYHYKPIHLVPNSIPLNIYFSNNIKWDHRTKAKRDQIDSSQLRCDSYTRFSNFLALTLQATPTPMPPNPITVFIQFVLHIQYKRNNAIVVVVV